MHNRPIVNIQYLQGFLLTASRDGTARIWSMDPADAAATSLHTFRAATQLSYAKYLPKSNLVLLSDAKELVFHSPE